MTMEQLAEQLPMIAVEGKRAPSRFYLPELDGLRFYAFLGVFVCHSIPSKPAFYQSLHLPLPGLWGAIPKAGSAGVDLFFALSAFLITSLLLREREEPGGISLRLFYLRRVLRIWPLYFAVLAVAVVLAHTIPKQGLPWYYVLGFALFIGNWVVAVCGHPQSFCNPLWTVSIEEQFYLLWPLLMRILNRRGMILAAAATFLLATISQIVVAFAGLSGGYIYYGSLSRCAPLALGVLMALFAEQLPRPTRSIRFGLVVGGLSAWILASAWLLEQPGPVDMRMVLGRFMASVAAGAILLGCLHSRSQLLRAPWIVKMGKVSYGLYLLHLLGILIAVNLLHASQGGKLLAAKLLGLGITVLLALASYRWIETPFLRLKDHFATVPSRPV
jgi:peptidoglycan/LPS O-acetylase OafA/YrhL